MSRAGTCRHALLAFALAAAGSASLRPDRAVAVGVSAAAALAPSTAFHLHGPALGLDTTGSFGGGPLEPGVERRVQAAGFNTNVATARRAALRVTAFDAAGFGVVHVHPCGAYDPKAPAVLRVGAAQPTELAWSDLQQGATCVTSTVRTNLRVYVEGYEEPAEAGGLSFVAFDATTVVRDVSLAAGQATPVPMTGRFGIPAGTPGVSLLFEASGPTAAGVVAHSCDLNPPAVPMVHHDAGESAVSGAIGVLSTAGTLCLTATAPTTLSIEVNGYWSSNEPATPDGPTRHLVGTARAGFVGRTPTRLLDTRTDGGIVPGGAARRLDLARLAPAGARDVVMNVTVTESSADGFLTVYPCDAGRPLASNLNFRTGQTVPNLVTVSVGSPPAVCFYANVATHVVADLSGWFVVGEGGGLVTRTPSRLFDTRTGAPLGAGATYELDLSGSVAADTSAVVMNVTVTGAQGPGYVTVYPCRAGRPTASNLNYVAGLTVPNLTMVDVGPDRRVCFYTSASVHLLADLSGWFSPASPLGYVGEVPERLFDTRETGAVFAGTSISYPGGRLPQPPGVRALPGIDALLLNVTVIAGFYDTFVTVYPCADDRPNASNLNAAGSQVVPNLVLAALDASGRICLYSQQTSFLLADEAGFFTTAPYTFDLFVR